METRVAAQRAADLVKRGRLDEAERAYRDLLAQVHAADYEIDGGLRELAALLVRRRRAREAGYVYLYLQDVPAALAALPAEARFERARAVELDQKPAQAARLYLEAGRPVHAAIQYERAGDDAAACEAWRGLLGGRRLERRPYEEALVHFNLGLAARRAGETDEGERHLVIAQQRLEQVADDLETRGLRERAFDCYAILLKLGQDSGSFENLCEGYLNCIRVLKEDNLKFYVLQYYEDFLRLALEREELHAAATLFREAADYSQRAGLVYERHYLGRAAEAWLQAAAKNERDGGPVELSENALLAAVDCHNAVGDTAAVAGAYRRLAELALAEPRRRRYAGIAARYDGAPREELYAPPFPDYLRQPHAYAQIWHADLIEWELDGDPADVCGAIAGNVTFPDSVRRKALALILAATDARGAPAAGANGAAEGAGRGTPSPEVLAQLAAELGEVQSYSVLRPLEKLLERPEPVVRAGVMKALRYLFYKRTFGALGRGLADADARVRQAALESLRHLHFPHSFDPLARIFREHRDPAVRAAALESLGRIGTLEVAELLIGVVLNENAQLRDMALRALAAQASPDLLPILQRHAELAQGPARAALSQLLARLRPGGAGFP